MADNVAVTPGAGANIATDDCGASGHIQRVKLDIGGDGVSSPVAAGNGLPITPNVVTSGNAANVSSSITNVTLLASNTNRKGFSIFNDSLSNLYVKFGATASTSSFHVKMTAGSYYESPAGFNYTGIIDGLWASANGAARVGEFT